jgi:PAS domain S-box-containing protein
MDYKDFDENIGYHVLLELASNNAGEYDEQKIIDKTLSLYLRKLNCYAAAIFVADFIPQLDLKKALPRTFPNSKEWDVVLTIIKQISHQDSEKDKYYEFLNDASSYYIYELNNYGYLVLCSNRSFSNQLKNELINIVNGLSRSLVLSKEIKQRKQFESKLFDTLHQLDLLYSFMNLSQDAIQVSKEDGQLVFINKVASARLGINQFDVEKYFVQDIELIFKDNHNKWDAHVKDLKSNGKQVIYGKNINQNTNEIFYVEVTASYQIIDNKGYVIAISRDVTERKLTELELIKTKEFLESVSKMTLTGGWELNTIRNQINLNTEAKNILEIDQGITDNDMLMVLFKKTIASSKQIKTRFSQLKKNSLGFDDVFEIVTIKGNKKYLRIIADVQLNNYSDKILFGAIQDVTEKSITQQRLILSENKFRSFVENANEIILNVDLHGRVVYISPNVKEKLGYDHNKLIGRYINEFLHKDDLIHAQTVFKKIVKSRKRYSNAIYRVINKKGELLWFIMSGSMLYADGVNSDSVLAVAHDITAIKNAEDELRRSKHIAEKLALQYKSILDSQTVFILKLNKSGIITYVNDFYIQSIGFNDSERGRKELLSTSIFNRIMSDDKHKLEETIRNSVKNPLTTYSVVLKELSKNKLQKAIRWEIKAIVESDSELEFLCVGIDITEQITNLERANQLLSTTAKQNFKLKNFAYIVSHNIRSHSSNISGIIRELKDVEDENERKYFLKLLEAGADKLDETIYNLNEIISINENIGKEFELKYLKEEVDKTFDVLSNSIIKNHVKIRNNVNKDIRVKVIIPYLESVLLNMISNAVKYRSEKNPEIIVSAETESRFIKISFIDNGLGIDLNKYGDKLYGMYKTFHNHKDSRGLGLFITKAQIEAMGGKIEVESEPGKGTTFHVYLLKYEK